jgi:hypothetical protein
MAEKSPKGDTEQKNPSRQRGLGEIVSGLAIFLLLSGAIMVLIKFQLIIPRSMLNWLSQSPDPQRAIISFSALVASLIMIVLRLGIQIPFMEKWVKSDDIRRYLSGLPLWAILIILVASVAGLLVVFPSCQPPASVVFVVQGREDPLGPSDVLTARPGEALTITAEAIQENAILSCKWQYVGDAFETLGESHRCELNLVFANQPGSGFLTLQASQDFCSQSSIFSLQVEVSEP